MESAGELRQNVLTGRWSVVVPGRGKRPVQSGTSDDTPVPKHDGSCPFCPGNEHEISTILFEAEDPDHEHDWAVRVAPNRYPAFTNHAARGEWLDTSIALTAQPLMGRPLPSGPDGPVLVHRPLPAVGYQEVVIESPRHDLDLSDLTGLQLQRVLDVYRSRYRTLSAAIPDSSIVIFRNQGAAAGASLVHPHGQIVATALVPPGLDGRAVRMERFNEDRGRCLLCSLPELEPDFEARVVVRNGHFVAVTPWASETPYDTWIVPRTHQVEFGEMSDEQLSDLAEVLAFVLEGLRDRAGDPPYNLMVHSQHVGSMRARAHHWMIHLRPRAEQPAGYEFASGVYLNPSSPEDDARILRGDDSSRDHDS